MAVNSEKIIAALKDCADELEGWVSTYYKGTLDYPSEKRRHDRDMQPVLNAREIIKEIENGTTLPDTSGT